MRRKGRSNTVKPFGISDKLGYMFGDLGNDFTFMFASSYVMIFYSKVMGISTGIIGTMFVIARCLDAVTDIGMGRIVDICKPGKDGKFKCWIRRISGLVALSSFLMYQSFLQDASMNIKIAYMFITYLLWGSVFYTAINIPYGSMASVISGNPKDRSSLSVFRSLGSMLAMIIITVTAPLVIYYTDSEGNQVVDSGRFTILAGVFSVCAVISYLFCYFMTTERVKAEPVSEISTQKIPFKKVLKDMMKNKAFWGMTLTAILMMFATSWGQSLNNFLFADYFQNTVALSVYSILALPATLLLLGISTPLSVRFGKKECGVACYLAAGLIYVLIAVARFENVWIFIVVSFIAIIAKQCFGMQAYALVTDVIDDLEVQTGSRDDGIIYGIYSFARKLGQAIAGGVSGWALEFIGYNSAAIAQTDEVRMGVYQISAIFPAATFLLCAAIFAFLYPLNRKRVNSNVEELEKRQKTRGK
ncbi:MAG: MFS transporter [Roseburia sp.]|nr:MFS transporter [Roseburia sp.]